jgi:tetratricopeptide (TPR) repeat protein
VTIIALVILLVAVSAGAVFLFARFRRSELERRAIRDKYGEIIDRDQEIERRNASIRELEARQARVESESSARATELNNALAENKAALEALRKELSILEESTELQSYGVYKPHYDFGTSEEFRAKLDEVADQEKKLIAAEGAVVCPKEWTVQGSRAEGRKMVKQQGKLMLRAFNGECDAAIAKARWNNITVMEMRIQKAHEAINKLGTVQDITITKAYFDLKMRELRLTYELQLKLHAEREEQRRIQEQMREEEKARREFERAVREAERDEEALRKAMLKAEQMIAEATAEQRDKYEAQLTELNQKLKEAEERSQRAKSMAEQTKRGHVYIISNIGSFGENVYKIGLTRRLDPFDRVSELGDSSVPFEFDVHAMIYSEDAPALETRLHNHFLMTQMNKVNYRKEFFKVDLAHIREEVTKLGVDAKWTLAAEAREYRETLAIEEMIKDDPGKRRAWADGLLELAPTTGLAPNGEGDEPRVLQAHTEKTA